MSFLHGVETVEVNNGARPITVVKSSIIALTGTAPIGPLNTLTLITNERQAVEIFGKQLPDFTIPQALAAIFAQGAGTVVVENIFDPETHVTEVDSESLTILNGKEVLAFAPIGGVITLTNQAADETYVAGTDYSVDEYGNIQVLDFDSIAEGATVLATYDKIDTSAINAALVLGSASTPRKGLKHFVECYSTFGFTPKIFLCPTYCEVAGVATEMIAQAEALKGIALIDAPVSTSVATALASRGPAGTLNGFKSASDRAVLLYPYVKVLDPATNTVVNRPYSPYYAGVMAKTDNNLGYWFSPSNKEILGLEGIELILTAAINDITTETNQLNAVGITTIYNTFGSGIRTFGNRSALYPSDTTPENFVAIRRLKDILQESVELSMLPFLDLPINQALIDSIRESVNSFINTLIGRGALIVGSECTYNPDNNPPEQISAGQLVFDFTIMGPVPAERITFNSILDINLLKSLV